MLKSITERRLFRATTQALLLALHPTRLTREETTTTASSPRRTQIAVVGSGPSGCYVAHLLTKKRDDVHVDMFERLPVPFGLSRYGVAPDHPEVKNVEEQFLKMFKSGRVTWIGNVSIGKELPLELLLANYTAVVLATGAGNNRKLHIPGEDLAGVVSAADFVRYYNTYPFPYGSPRFCPFELPTAREVVLVGNGNVALDCARVLAASYKYFAPTDMNCVAVRELMANRVRRINIVARRGHAYSAFTIAEFRELTRFQPNTVRVVVDPFDLPKALEVPAENPRARKRLLELIARFTENSESNNDISNENGGVLNTPSTPLQHGRGPCLVHFRYNMRPVRFLPHPERRRHVGAVVFERTDGAQQQNEATHENDSRTVTIPCDVALTSVGYSSDGIPGVPFDESRGVIPHQHGRVKGQPRVYCAGWVKNGPRGVILQSLMDAQETVASILDDLANNLLPTHGSMESSLSSSPSPPHPVTNATDTTPSTTTVNNDDNNNTTCRNKQRDAGSSDGNEFYGKYGLIDFFVEKRLEPVSMAGLERILHVEAERGVDLGKRLEKIDNVRSMLDVALGGSVGKKANNSIRGITNERPDALLYLNELLDDTTDLRPFARELAKELTPVMATQHPPGPLHPSQL